MDSQMAIVISANGNNASVKLGSGESKTARIPRGASVLSGDKVLVEQVAGKYMIINVY